MFIACDTSLDPIEIQKGRKWLDSKDRRLLLYKKIFQPIRNENLKFCGHLNWIAFSSDECQSFRACQPLISLRSGR